MRCLYEMEENFYMSDSAAKLFFYAVRDKTSISQLVIQNDSLCENKSEIKTYVWTLSLSLLCI